MTEGYTRREFIRQVASATAALAMPGWVDSIPSRGRMEKRVLVVGAGVAGLCAAYELTAMGHDVTVLEAQAEPGGRVRTLRSPFVDGLYAEAGASRIPTSHDLTLRYARQFDLKLVPFAPAGTPSVRYAYGQRTIVRSDDPFEWPLGIPENQKRLTPGEVRRRYIEILADKITDPFSIDWIPSELKEYDGTTRDQYLRAQGVSDAVLHLMNLGSTPVARLRSFLDVLHEIAVNRELRRRSGLADDQLLKIDGGNDQLPRAFASRLSNRIRYRCAVRRIEHDAHGVRLVYQREGSKLAANADYVVCAIPFSTLRSVEISPPLSPEKRTVIANLPYHSATRIYLQCRTRYWKNDGLSGFADTDHPMEVWDATHGQRGRRGILMSFMQGPRAREIGEASEAEQLRFGLEAMEEIYPGLQKNYERGFVKVWDHEPWARGAVAYLRPGEVLSLEPHIARAEGRIHFAGEHASSLRGWMQGAFESGLRAASEVDEAHG